jgi:hypothetical protein
VFSTFEEAVDHARQRLSERIAYLSNEALRLRVKLDNLK